MSDNKYHNPFLPPDCQDEPFSDPFNDGSIERYAKLQLTEYEVSQLPEADAELLNSNGIPTYSDGCAMCYTTSGFKTKFVAGKSSNKVCNNCMPH
jgi:hypothetical protein